jgi:hypothetical protein
MQSDDERKPRDKMRHATSRYYGIAMSSPRNMVALIASGARRRCLAMLECGSDSAGATTAVPSNFAQAASCRLSDIKSHDKTCLRSKIDQRIQAEIRNFAAQKIIQARLRDPETLRGFCLGDFPTPHPLLDCDQQTGSHRHIRSLGRRVFQSVPHVVKTLSFHRRLH